MYTVNQPRRPKTDGPKFMAGGGWSTADGSDSDTEHSPPSRDSHSLSPLRQAGSGPRDGESPDERPSVSIEPSVDQPTPMAPHWSAKRHLTCGNPTPPPPWSAKPIPWRYGSPGKLKTANAALVLCLNIDIDPPDVVKTNPCATLECWVDPHSMPTHKALEAIGQNLQHQFEGLSLKIQYKSILDPSFEDLKKSCHTLRKQAKEDAVLFHYNGHGVPKPTPSGELWCFNRDYTQYIPVSLQDLQGWIGSPAVYIWDCSAAGNLLQNFNIFAERRDNDAKLQPGDYPRGAQPFMQSLQLAACAANEQLPTCPELPADLPGDLKDRRTPLGELNWIFTAITDTIAWTSFSRETFTRLYRCDLLIASLFRNFLLAERIMKNYNCTPHTYPPLPATNTHPLWATWDLAVDFCLRQLPNILAKPEEGSVSTVPVPPTFPSPPLLRPGRIGQTSHAPPKAGEKPSNYIPNRFFADQLTAFEVWISRGGSALTRRGPLSLPASGEKANNPPEIINAYERHHLVPRKPPDQLPIVLQVLLSQPHRLRALILLSQFVDLGPWAVNLVLTIGIFPYISKLLQAPGQDLRPVLIFIWARILAVDPSVQHDLYNNQQGYKYFSNILSIKNDIVLPNWSEHQAMCSFILAAMARDFPAGQQACWDERVFEHCYERLEDPDFLLRQWTALCIGQMWDSNDLGKYAGLQRNTPEKLALLLSDYSVEVRCAALFALGTFMGANGSADPAKHGGGGTGTMNELGERTHFKMEVAVVTGATLLIKDDASPMCRKELLVMISCLVKEWRGHFVVCAWLYWEEDRKWKAGELLTDDDLTTEAVAQWLERLPDELREESRVLLSSFFTIFVVLLDLSVDPYHEVATNAQTIVDYIMVLLLDSPFKRLECTSLHLPPPAPGEYQTGQMGPPRTRVGSLQSSPSLPPASPTSLRPNMTRSDTMDTISTSVSSTMRRTASFANALKSLANGIAFPSSDDVRSTTMIPPQRSDVEGVSRPPSPNLNFAHYESAYSRPPSPLKRNGETSPPQFETLPSSFDYPQFDPSEAIEALMEEDLERLRARRPRHHRSHHRGSSIPSPSGSIDSSSSSVILGIGTGLGVRDVLPLKSTFFDWCCEYFAEPQMRQTEVDEPGSVQYNYQVWRQHRNEQLVEVTRGQIEVASGCRWDRSVATFNGPANPLTMAFHSYDQHLVIANESDLVCVWDWSKRKRLNSFYNGNARGTSITALKIINQEVGGIIVTGSADGLVRLYRNYDPSLDQGPVQMVSAFRALNEVVQVRQGSGMVMDWEQSTGILLVAGDSRVIKAWDAGTETQGLDLDTNSDSPVTAIVSDHGASPTFVASFADGAIKAFDRRMEDDNAIIMTYNEHKSWVQNVKPHPSVGSQFLSASLDGEVKLWDIRGGQKSVETWVADSSGIAAFDVHPMADIFGMTSAISPSNWKSQRITVRSVPRVPEPGWNGDLLTKINISTGHGAPPSRVLPSPYIPRTSSLVFHPTEMLYGIGQPDGTIRIMGCNFASPIP
ncbi:raptor N-terminal caspase like domain-containing protein [Mycena floridula]|nr:raptor N-terminal caspase like domain-containing protein [Mycena floridula]